MHFYALYGPLVLLSTYFIPYVKHPVYEMCYINKFALPFLAGIMTKSLYKTKAHSNVNIEE